MARWISSSDQNGIVSASALIRDAEQCLGPREVGLFGDLHRALIALDDRHRNAQPLAQGSVIRRVDCSRRLPMRSNDDLAAKALWRLRAPETRTIDGARDSAGTIDGLDRIRHRERRNGGPVMPHG